MEMMQAENKLMEYAPETLRFLEGNFRAGRLSLMLTPQERVALGPDLKKGDRWRGGILETLRRLSDRVCFYWKSPPACSDCDMKPQCMYHNYFLSEKPRPFILVPVLDGREKYGRNDTFQLDIILIGDAIDYHERFIEIIELLGRLGIGAGRGAFFIKDALMADMEMPSYHCGVLNTERIKLSLRTPLKIKDEKNSIYYEDIPFETFFKFLFNRICNLTNLYCGVPDVGKAVIEKEKRGLMQIAQNVTVIRRTKWDGEERYSSRQKEKLKIEGQVGRLELSGELKPFYPFLKLGEIVGVGSDTVIGFGRYECL
jgi:CRISPR-associated endoribonuclease Cas6